MASFQISFQFGNNLVSIPLDMTAEGYEDDPKVLFNPNHTWQQGNTLIPFYNFIIADGLAIFNVPSPGGGREWSGNYNSIKPQHGFWVNLSLPHNRTFNGDSLVGADVEYDIRYGANLFSFPFPDESIPFGSGAYAEPEVPYAIKTNYLSASENSEESFTYFQGFGVNKSFNGGDLNNPLWGGNLTAFYPGKGYWMVSDHVSTITNADIWDPAQDNYEELPIGGTPANTNGNRTLHFPEWWGPTIMTANMYINSYPLEAGGAGGFRIKDHGGTDRFNMFDATTVAAGVGVYHFGLFIKRLYDETATYKMYGCRGGFIEPSDVTGNSILIDGSSVTSGNEPDTPLHTTINLNFNQYNGKPNSEIMLVCVADNENETILDSLAYKGFKQDDVIIPSLYDPSTAEHHYCKYYPSKNDAIQSVSGQEPMVYFKDMDEYKDIFFQEGLSPWDSINHFNVAFNYDGTYTGYIKAVDKEFPYKFQNGKILSICGIFRALPIQD